jgi:hypothetical protein
MAATQTLNLMFKIRTMTHSASTRSMRRNKEERRDLRMLIERGK